MKLCRSLSHWHVINIFIMLLITCKGSEKELQNSYYVFYIKKKNTKYFQFHHLRKLFNLLQTYIEVFALCTVSPQLMLGLQFWKLEHTAKQKMFFQHELIKIPENPNSEDLPAVSRNNINLNPSNVRLLNGQRNLSALKQNFFSKH